MVAHQTREASHDPEIRERLAPWRKQLLTIFERIEKQSKTSVKDAPNKGREFPEKSEEEYGT